MITTNKMVYSYYPGCSLTGTNRAYDFSTRAAAQALGIDLIELDDWNCCGATAYMSVSEKRSFVLSARNLALAEKAGHDLVTVCTCCYLVLRKTNKYMAANENVMAEIQRALAAGGMSYEGGVRIRHFLDVVVRDLGETAIREQVKHPLNGLKVAPYYGCQISRPFGEIDDPENPQMMDNLVAWLGAEPTFFPLKARCCGGMMMTTKEQVGQELSAKVLKAAKDAGADCVMTACPLCQLNLEGYQDKLCETLGADCRIPVLYFTQLVGVALGLDSGKLALKDSLTPVEKTLAEKVLST
jgi:heterodisulfide reductase subunit B